jgi:hypothetical protein
MQDNVPGIKKQQIPDKLILPEAVKGLSVKAGA